MKGLTMCCAFGLMIAVGVFSSDLKAEVRPAINYDYFQVPYIPGKSVADMILISTPLMRDNGHRSVGRTAWRIIVEETAFTQPKIGVCRIVEPKVTCRCDITLPQLQGGDDASRSNFEKIAAETKIHELEHCRIAAKFATELEQAIMEMKELRCDEVDKVMRGMYDKAVDDCSVEQARFDHAEYGYSQYLHLEGLQKMHEAGFDVTPPAEGRSMPQLDHRKKSELKAIPQGVEELKQEGFYKDENGVWRNY